MMTDDELLPELRLLLIAAHIKREGRAPSSTAHSGTSEMEGIERQVRGLANQTRNGVRL